MPAAPPTLASSKPASTCSSLRPPPSRKQTLLQLARWMIARKSCKTRSQSSHRSLPRKTRTRDRSLRGRVRNWRCVDGRTSESGERRVLLIEGRAVDVTSFGKEHVPDFSHITSTSSLVLLTMRKSLSILPLPHYRDYTSCYHFATTTAWRGHRPAWAHRVWKRRRFERDWWTAA